MFYGFSFVCDAVPGADFPIMHVSQQFNKSRQVKHTKIISFSSKGDSGTAAWPPVGGLSRSLRELGSGNSTEKQNNCCLLSLPVFHVRYD